MRSDEPLVSMIVVSHDGPDYLAACLDSVKRQSYATFECIIVLDGTANSKLLRAATDTIGDDNRFLVVTLSHRRERNYCRNVGIALATGQYVCFVDGDDELPVESIETRLRFSRQTGEKAVFGGLVVFTEADQVSDVRFAPQYTHEQLRISWPHHCCLLLQREFLGDVRYPALPQDRLSRPSQIAGEDVEFMHRLLERNGPEARFVSCGEPVYRYRRHNSASYQMRHESILSVIDVLVQHHGSPDPGSPYEVSFMKRVAEYVVWRLFFEPLSEPTARDIDRDLRSRGIDMSCFRDAEVTGLAQDIQIQIQNTGKKAVNTVEEVVKFVFARIVDHDHSRRRALSHPKNAARKCTSNLLRAMSYPVLKTKNELQDAVWRIAWHFSHVPDVEVAVPILKGVDWSTATCAPPAGFDQSIQDVVRPAESPIRFVVATVSDTMTMANEADIILEIEKGSLERDRVPTSGKRVYRVDPDRERNEGSFYIQAAFEAMKQKTGLIAESERKMQLLIDEVGIVERSWVLATGPSVERYVEHDFTDDLVIVCNSVILNQDILNRSGAKILVFADPIFHFGVSQYAGHFRRAMIQAVQSRSLWVLTPFKYYPLLTSVCPSIRDRVIGVPMYHRPDFNTDMAVEFQVKITSNILTLLMLPLAATLSRHINLLGCDGRPVEADEYFWGHGKTVQINDKMDNIKDVHPGFFKIDYNKYYFEHCHTLSRMVDDIERSGKTVVHRAPSHIPVLQKRAYDASNAFCGTTGEDSATVYILLEPDGVGINGHYIDWHNHLTRELQGKCEKVFVLCNLKQDPGVYDAVALPTFTSTSWALSRGSGAFEPDYQAHQRVKAFRQQLGDRLRSISSSSGESRIHVFIYYASTQIVDAIEHVRVTLGGEGISLKVTASLFFEGVNLNDERHGVRIPPMASESLMRVAANELAWTLCSVSSSLSVELEKRLGVRTKVLPNPPPGLNRALLIRDSQTIDRRNDRFVVAFPGDAKKEKGIEIVREFLRDFARRRARKEVQNYEIWVRTSAAIESGDVTGVKVFDDTLPTDSYHEMLTGADVVVLPYQSPHFKYRTSGILADTLEAGKPAIVISDTWLADEIGRLRSGLVVSYYSPETLWSAIKVVRENYDWFQRHTAYGSEKYRSGNNWKLLSEVISGQNRVPHSEHHGPSLRTS